jgi:hypothetical protein
MAFDKSRPYAELFGAIEDGARYIQDGVRYSFSGEEVGREANYAPVVEPLPVVLKPKPARSVGLRRGFTHTLDRENAQALRAEELAE